jgi:hypothetical protein
MAVARFECAFFSYLAPGKANPDSFDAGNLGQANKNGKREIENGLPWPFANG